MRCSQESLKYPRLKDSLLPISIYYAKPFRYSSAAEASTISTICP